VHAVHSVEALNFSNLPAGHEVHTEEPASAAKDPEVQLEHVRAPLLELYFPAAHNWQAAIPVEGAICPGGHTVQAEAPSIAKRPAGQARH
jgi:hypothetical protein